MLNQLKALSNNIQLWRQVKTVDNLDDAIALIKSAGAQKGYQFSHDGLTQLLQSQVETIDEKSLLDVAGGAHGAFTGRVSCSPYTC
ncbi:Nif11-like leader peptide family natural product precursor [Leptothoe spongobia]|uniref:Nif11-like leader peptide family natural product n=1 Tax=Leptothoe spongobia TAU-MAC 1115 TaxID=1967444 RepID=A0A947DFU8_9CYAN|nr:Nif11-like leader peptide family natural product precursor [Leptothoe spongobia]MBT9315798.1 Nif11-like leader peptide family natural product precursor [Leptothoe spongobia TAU-MAC 1115]